MPKTHIDMDNDMDGQVTEKEAELTRKIYEIENRNKKEDQQRRIAAIAMGSMILVTIGLFLPFTDVERINAMSDLISMFYIAQSGIVATFFGATAYMTVNK